MEGLQIRMPLPASRVGRRSGNGSCRLLASALVAVRHVSVDAAEAEPCAAAATCMSGGSTVQEPGGLVRVQMGSFVVGTSSSSSAAASLASGSPPSARVPQDLAGHSPLHPAALQRAAQIASAGL